MKKLIKSLAVLAATSLAFASVSHAQPASAVAEVKIGYLLPLSADNAPQGQQSKRAVDMAVEMAIDIAIHIVMDIPVNIAVDNTENLSFISQRNSSWRCKEIRICNEAGNGKKTALAAGMLNIRRLSFPEGFARRLALQEAFATV